jgi:outer membrane receptor protein involved in Fe transport
MKAILILISLISETDTLYTLPEIVVEASLYKRGAFFIDTVRIERGKDLSELLATRRGVFFRSYGNLYSASLRGVPVEETSILLEGIPINLPQSGYVDLTLIPDALLEKVDLIRGASSPVMGPGCIGGAINFRIVTPKVTHLYLEGGSFGRKRIAFVGGKRLAGGLLQLGLSSFSILNNYPYRINSDIRLRENSYIDRMGGILRYIHSKTSLSLLFSKTRVGIPGSIGFPTLDRRREDIFGVFGITQQLGDIFLNLNVLKHSMEYWGASYETHLNRRYGIEVYTSNFSLFLKREEVNSSRIGERERNYWGFCMFLVDSFGNIKTTAVVREDFYSGTGFVLQYEGGIRLEENGIEGILSFSKGFRPPTFNELYWSDEWAVGNPRLRPVNSMEFNLGIIYEAPLRVEGVLFVREVKDEIVWVPDYGVWKPLNLNKVHYKGFEGSISLGTLKGEVTLLSAKSGGENLVYRPSIYGNIKWENDFLWIEFQYIGRRPSRASGPKYLPPVYLLNQGVRLKYGRFSLFFSIFNLLDKNYEYVEGYPLPGRELRLGIEMRMKGDLEER